MKILLLSPYPPYPPRGGGAMRIYQIIRGLAQRHTLTCLTFVPDAAAEQALAPLRDLCRLITVRGPAPRSLIRRAWTTLASPLPDMALRNASPAFRALLCDLVAREHVDIVQAESIEMASYLVDLARNAGASSSIVQRPLLALDQFNAEYVLQKRAAITDLRAACTLADPVRRGAGGIYSSDPVDQTGALRTPHPADMRCRYGRFRGGSSSAGTSRRNVPCSRAERRGHHILQPGDAHQRTSNATVVCSAGDGIQRNARFSSQYRRDRLVHRSSPAPHSRPMPRCPAARRRAAACADLAPSRRTGTAHSDRRSQRRAPIPGWRCGLHRAHADWRRHTPESARSIRTRSAGCQHNPGS
jgi:hypothetical protein